ncbi:MAG: hypothetical protein IJZ93_00015 [Clostridia bacterium]|nr:hypothetical protein [Clostridia bacterium]
MNGRIDKLTELTLKGEMYVDCVPVKREKEDSEADALCKYILAQEPKINEYCAFTGRFNFDGSVVGDAFKRGGHKFNLAALDKYYLKPIENLSTMEWQHATADYKRVLEKGILGIIEDIDASIRIHKKASELEFLNDLKKVAFALIKWCEKCSERAYELACTVTDAESKARLDRLSKALLKAPKCKPSSFYEAVLSIFVCFSADPDSVGTLDRYLTPFYENDIRSGALTKGEAKEYLKELFLMLQASTPISSVHFTRGGESHFCIGGYLPNGEDGFNELSYLIAESMVELPTYIPQLTLRWTSKTPREVFRFMMELERRDPHKRIAFTNDEKRIKCYTELCSIPYERAVSYTTVGCNEPAFLGAITGSTSKGNILRCIDTLFHERSEAVKGVSDFEQFYGIFEGELFSDLKKILDYDDMYNAERSKDINYISSLFFNDCIENAKSLTQGGGNVVIASPMLIGITNLIDSLITVKQFVFDEGLISMDTLICALKANWQGYEDIRAFILNKGKFFGNDDETSNYVASRVYKSLYSFYSGRKNIFGYQFLVGDLLGYNEHHKWFGEATRATPDGRYCGELIKFGIGQSGGRDRGGLSALLNSISSLDPYAIGCGSTVTNIFLDEALVKNDDSFEKLVIMLETFFKNGGVHFQLTYVSKKDLILAKQQPENYSSLRVRVTGFSDYFVKLKESIQDDIIERTAKKE